MVQSIFYLNRSAEISVAVGQNGFFKANANAG
jgi:hypothetical protein